MYAGLSNFISQGIPIDVNITITNLHRGSGKENLKIYTSYFLSKQFLANYRKPKHQSKVFVSRVKPYTRCDVDFSTKQHVRSAIGLLDSDDIGDCVLRVRTIVEQKYQHVLRSKITFRPKNSTNGFRRDALHQDTLVK